jgi:hypothetical protein
MASTSSSPIDRMITDVQKKCQGADTPTEQVLGIIKTTLNKAPLPFILEILDPSSLESLRSHVISEVVAKAEKSLAAIEAKKKPKAPAAPAAPAAPSLFSMLSDVADEVNSAASSPAPRTDRIAPKKPATKPAPMAAAPKKPATKPAPMAAAPKKPIIGTAFKPVPVLSDWAEEPERKTNTRSPRSFAAKVGTEHASKAASIQYIGKSAVVQETHYERKPTDLVAFAADKIGADARADPARIKSGEEMTAQEKKAACQIVNQKTVDVVNARGCGIFVRNLVEGIKKTHQVPPVIEGWPGNSKEVIGRVRYALPAPEGYNRLPYYDTDTGDNKNDLGQAATYHLVLRALLRQKVIREDYMLVALYGKTFSFSDEKPEDNTAHYSIGGERGNCSVFLAMFAVTDEDGGVGVAKVLVDANTLEAIDPNQAWAIISSAVENPNGTTPVGLYLNSSKTVDGHDVEDWELEMGIKLNLYEALTPVYSDRKINEAYQRLYGDAEADIDGIDEDEQPADEPADE